jgi:hypothetical protein
MRMVTADLVKLNAGDRADRCAIVAKLEELADRAASA